MASNDPTTQAAAARGILSRQTTSPCWLAGSLSAASHSCQDMGVEPIALEKRILPIDTSNSKISSIRRNVIGIILQD